jgi:alcohol dehydrogenase class IV
MKIYTKVNGTVVKIQFYLLYDILPDSWDFFNSPAVHGFARPLGGIIKAPHGIICARFLPFVFEANIKALKSFDSKSAILARFDEIAQILTANPNAAACDGMKWLQKLYEKLDLPKLTKFGLKEELFAEVVANAKKSSSMKGNPIEISDGQLLNILQKCRKS